METISKDKAIKLFYEKESSLFTIADAKKIFPIENDNTLYKLLQRLERSGVIKRVVHGKYQFLFREINDFSLANFLVTPSYISLESALSFYGILPQFPYSITSVTPLKSKRIQYEQKEYEFVHLKRKYFFGFVKKDTFLIASPEKALLDELYFIAKGLRKIHLEDLEVTGINREYLVILSKRYKFLPLQRILKNLSLC